MLNTISLSQNERQIILGGVLGDSTFNIKQNGYSCYHCEKQRAYLNWKHSMFNSENVSEIKKSIHVWGGREYTGYYYRLHNRDGYYSGVFDLLKSCAYTDTGKKKITMELLDQLDPLGLAVWWLDDGSLVATNKSRWGKLSTHAFSEEEHIIIKEYFRLKWGINSSIKTEKGKYHFLRFGAKDMKRLISLIYKYVCQVPDMIYKIDMKYNNYGSIGEDFIGVYNYINEHKSYKEDP